MLRNIINYGLCVILGISGITAMFLDERTIGTVIVAASLIVGLYALAKDLG